MEPSEETPLPETQPELEGHPLEELPEALHPTHALVLEAHAALKRALHGVEHHGHPFNPDDVRLAFRALDAVLAEVNRG
jgi:hypothetical protein